MKTIAKIVIALIIFVILLFAGCAALIGGAAEQVEKDSQKNAITEQQFKSVKQGATLESVKKEFGKPDDQQVTETDGLKMVCIYYPVKDGEFMDSYQFCFDNGRLTSKSDY